MSSMDDFIRRAAGRGAAAGTESGQPAVDEKEATYLAEVLGLTMDEARERLARAAVGSAEEPRATPGNAGAGTGRLPNSPMDMNEWIRSAWMRTGPAETVVLPGGRQNDGR